MTYRDLVETLKRGEDVLIRGDVGGRLGSSLGVDLKSFGGSGLPIENTGSIFVEGNVGPRLGISMVKGRVYVSGIVEQPLGNVIEIETDRTGYRKYVSVTEILKRGGQILSPNVIDEKGLVLKDGLLRETLAARSFADKNLRVEGDVGMSAGILMRRGSLEILGNAGRNTGVLLSGGELVIRGDCDDFTAAEMRGGQIFVEGDAGNYICAKMEGGAIYAKSGKPIPPAKMQILKGDETGKIAKVLKINGLQAMAYKKFSL